MRKLIRSMRDRLPASWAPFVASNQEAGGPTRVEEAAQLDKERG